MNTGKTLQVASISSADTERIAGLVAANLRGGEVIELVSDLGGGKTTFTRGLVAALGSNDHVSSPTFTISKVYKTRAFEVHHFDFYRLQDAGLASFELQDLLGDPGMIIVVEWGAVVERALPVQRLTIDLKRTGDDSRELSITYPDTLAYMIKGVC